MYRTFTRTWWKDNFNGNWPNNLEPHAGDKTYCKEYETEQEARAACREYNSENDPGRYSEKMEYEEI